MLAYPILAKKRRGDTLSAGEIEAFVTGATDGSWSDAQLAAFLMAAAIRELDAEETILLTRAMLESGEQWELAGEVPGLVDKHSTGGVGDKVSLILAPMLAACEIPVVMLTGRALGHTAGTADKLDAVAGLDQELDRARSLEMLRKCGLAIGVATAEIAPADRRLYRLRDQTATVDSLPLITGSILSKKLASGAEALVFDVKTGNGAFMSDHGQARELAELLVSVTRSMGRKATALITDMSQPLGDWVGHAAEVREALSCLEGRGPENLMEVTSALATELMVANGCNLTRDDLDNAISSGRARERFTNWAALQGAQGDWQGRPEMDLAPHEVVLESPRSGRLSAVDTRRIGMLMVEAGAGRSRIEDRIDHGVSLHYRARLGRVIEQGQELARLYLRQPNDDLTRRFAECFVVEETAVAPPLIVDRVPAAGG